MRHRFTAALAAALGVATLGAFAQAPSGDAARGQTHFTKAMCYTCHGTVGHGSQYGLRLAPNPIPWEGFAHQVRAAARLDAALPVAVRERAGRRGHLRLHFVDPPRTEDERDPALEGLKLAQAPWQTTSTRAGAPDFTTATARLNAAASCAGSVMGPSPHTPYA